ncbi:MAG: LamG-like jellyroll fold domain-containing protein, partial [archaeon]
MHASRARKLEQLKEKTLHVQSKLNKLLNERKISYQDYQEHIDKLFNGKPETQYYKEVEEEIRHLKRQPRTESRHTPLLAITVLLFGLLLVGMINYAGITGKLTFAQEKILFINKTFTENTAYDTGLTNVSGLHITGHGQGTARIYLLTDGERMLLFTTEQKNEQNLLTGRVIEETPPEQELPPEEITTATAPEPVPQDVIEETTQPPVQEESTPAEQIPETPLQETPADTALNTSFDTHTDEMIVEEIVSDNVSENSTEPSSEQDMPETPLELAENLTEENISQPIIDETQNETQEHPLNATLNESMNETANELVNATAENATIIPENTTAITENTTLIPNETTDANATLNETVPENVTIGSEVENETLIKNETLVENITQLEQNLSTNVSNATNVSELVPFSFDNVCGQACSLMLDKALLYIEVEGSITIDSITYTAGNREPEQIAQVGNYTLEENETLTINASTHFLDPDHDPLVFSTKSTDLTVEVHGESISFSGREGEYATFIYATDGESLVKSNVFLINITQNRTNATLPSFLRNLTRMVIINKPVRWVEDIRAEEIVQNFTTTIPVLAYNLSAKEITNNTVVEIPEEKITREGAPPAESAEDGLITGNVIADFSVPEQETRVDTSDSITITVHEEAQHIQVEYYTEGPTSTETAFVQGRKQVVVSSDVHYTDIFTYTAIPDVRRESITLYWLVNNTRVKVEGVSYYDENNNGLIDYISWITPSLSNQTYEVSITILNVQSYPYVGGLWQVSINTSGEGNLSIAAINGTTYLEEGNDNPETEDDLEILSLACGNATLFSKAENRTEHSYYVTETETMPVADFSNRSEHISYLYEDYSCNETATWTVKVHTAGKHVQQFTFGNETAYAFNDASQANMSTSRINPNSTANDTDDLYGYCNGTTNSSEEPKVIYNYTWYRNDVLNTSGRLFKANTITTGGVHTCGIRANDSYILCWGDNTYGQLGNGSTGGNSHNPIPINDTSAYLMVSASNVHTCAIRANDSRVLCWGDNQRGQLGDGTTTDKLNPTLINDTAAYTQVGVGGWPSAPNTWGTTCGIRANDSRVLCWGSNTYGQLGDGTEDTDRINPTLINTTSSFSSISVGGDSTCGIRANDSRVLCWGLNGNGQLGDGSTTQKNNPTLINDTSAYSMITIESFSNGIGVTCGIRANDSRVLCWGDNSMGQVGIGSATGNEPNPKQTTDTAAYSWITVSITDACGIRANDSRVLCWGIDYVGEGGHGDATERDSPVLIDDTASYVIVDAGGDNSAAFNSFSTCGVLLNGTAKCWGGNYYYELGDGTNTQRNSPVYVNSTSSYMPGFPSGQEVFVSMQHNRHTTNGDSWILSCQAQDGFSNSTWLNSSATTIGPPYNPPNITWEYPTPENGATTTNDWAYLNATVNASLNTSAFFDWNNTLGAYWNFEYYNTSGILDNSSNNYFATFGAGLSTSNISTGRYGKGLNFSTGATLSAAGANGTFITAPLTVEIWFKYDVLPNETGTASYIFGKWHSETPWYSWLIYGLASDNKTNVAFRNSTSTMSGVISDASATVGTWYHYVFTLNESYNVSVYINGDKQTATAGMTDLYPSNSSVKIGSSGYPFKGIVDEARIHQRVLSWQEINASYNNGLFRLENNFTQLDNGTYSYTAWATDENGNMTKSTQTITIDGAPPTVTLVSPANQTRTITADNTFTCNITDNAGIANVTLYVWNSTGDNVAADISEWCYQESANTLTSCGGLATGAYALTGMWTDGGNLNDGNYESYGTYLPDEEEPGYMYVNYSKPARAQSTSLWQVKDNEATMNLSLPQLCWDQTSLQLRAESDQHNTDTYWQCWNSTDWQTLRSYLSSARIWEEGMWWNISRTTVSVGGTSNSTNWTVTLPYEGSFTWNCEGNDSVGNSNWGQNYSIAYYALPNITWEDPTPEVGENITTAWAYLNATITSLLNTSAFFDWNRSLVAYYSFEYYNDTHVFDNSTYGYNATFTNMTPSPIGEGKFGQGVTFTGGNASYLNVSSNENLLEDYTEMTICLWFKRADDGLGTTQVLLRDRHGDNDNFTQLIWQESNSLIFGCKRAGTEYSVGLSDSILLADTWYYGCGTYNSTSMRVYVNGQLNDSLANGNCSLSRTNPNWVTIGSGSYCCGFNGSIDELKIWNRTLSWQEINASYNSGLYQLKNNFTDVTLGIASRTYNYTAWAIDQNGSTVKDARQSSTTACTSPSGNETLSQATNCADSNLAVDALTISSDAALNLTNTNLTVNVLNITGNLTLQNSTLRVNGTTSVANGAIFISRDGGSTLWFNDNLTINGTVIWDNETIRMNGTENGSANIIVQDAGNLSTNLSNITNGDVAEAKYEISADQTARLSIINTSIENVGWNLATGMTIAAQNFTYINSSAYQTTPAYPFQINLTTYNRIMPSNLVYYGRNDTLFLCTGCTLYVSNWTLLAGSIVKSASTPAGNGSINVANLNYTYSSSTLTYFTSINDNTVGANISGSNATPSKGDWGSINSTTTYHFEWMQVSYASGRPYLDGPTAGMIIYDNIFKENDGYINFNTITEFKKNLIINCTDGLKGKQINYEAFIVASNTFDGILGVAIEEIGSANYPQNSITNNLFLNTNTSISFNDSEVLDTYVHDYNAHYNVACRYYNQTEDNCTNQTYSNEINLTDNPLVAANGNSHYLNQSSPIINAGSYYGGSPLASSGYGTNPDGMSGDLSPLDIGYHYYGYRIPPYITVNSPANDATVSSVNLNISVNGTLPSTVRFFGSMNASQLDTSVLRYNLSITNTTSIYPWTSAPIAADDNTVLLVHFDNLSEYGENDTFARDYSGNDNNATCDSCPVMDITGGKFGGAYNFSGEEYVEVPYSSSLALSNYTVAAWVNVDNDGDNNCVLSTRIGATDELFNFKIMKSSIQGSIGNGSDWLKETAACSRSADVGTWVQIVYVVHDGGYEIYVNGLRCDSGEFEGVPLLIAATNNLTIGECLDGSEFMSGSIDDVAVWDRNLSAEEVYYLYTMRNGAYYWMATANDSQLQNATGTYNFTLNASPNIVVSLDSPADASTNVKFTGDAASPFSCTAATAYSTVNDITLYAGTVGWQNVSYQSVSGFSANTTADFSNNINPVGLLMDKALSLGCYATNNASQSNWSTNKTVSGFSLGNFSQGTTLNGIANITIDDTRQAAINNGQTTFLQYFDYGPGDDFRANSGEVANYDGFSASLTYESMNGTAFLGCSNLCELRYPDSKNMDYGTVTFWFRKSYSGTGAFTLLQIYGSSIYHLTLSDINPSIMYAANVTLRHFKTVQTITANSGIASSGWHMYAVVWNKSLSDGEITLYRDGSKLVNSSGDLFPGADIGTLSVNISIGANMSLVNDAAGYYDEIAIYDAAYSSSVISQLYTNQSHTRFGNYSSQVFDIGSNASVWYTLSAATNDVGNITFQARNCDDAACNGENFTGPSGSNSTYYTDLTGQELNASTSRYFQYKAFFGREITSSSQPELYAVNITYLANDSVNCTPLSYGFNVLSTCSFSDQALIINGSLDIGSTGYLNLSNVTLIVNGNTRVRNGGTFKTVNGGSTIWQNGNLTINGTYILNRETLRMNGSSDGTYGITVQGSGTFNVSNSSNITNGETSTADYAFVVQSGATFNVQDSLISRAGYSDTTGSKGLEISAANAILARCNLSYIKSGIHLLGGSANLTGNNISMTTESYTGTMYGIDVTGGSATIQNNYISTDLNQTTHLLEVASNSNTFRNNTLAGVNSTILAFIPSRQHNTFDDMTGIITNNVAGTCIYSSAATNNTFTNFSFTDCNASRMLYLTGSGNYNLTLINPIGYNTSNITFSSAGATKLYVKWFADLFVGKLSGTAVSGATVLAYDNSYALFMNTTTDASGLITGQSFYEYSQNSTQVYPDNVTYFTNYSFIASRAGYATTHNKTWNLTQSQIGTGRINLSIVGCGDTITTDTNFTGNLSNDTGLGCPAGGITVTSGAAVDCNNYWIYGGDQGTGTGILADGASSLTNCNVYGFNRSVIVHDFGTTISGGTFKGGTTNQTRGLSFDGDVGALTVQHVTITNSSEYGVYLEGVPSQDYTFNNITIENNSGTGVYYDDSTGYVIGITINNSRIRYNYNGIVLKLADENYMSYVVQSNITNNTFNIVYPLSSTNDQNLTFLNNNVFGGTYDWIMSGTTKDQNATSNWWGTTNENTIAAQILDYSDSPVVGRVIYCPYLTSAYPGASLSTDDASQCTCDETVGSTACNGASCYILNSTSFSWDIMSQSDGTYNSNCCGDDSTEFYAQASSSGLPGFTNTTSACCNITNSCVFDRSCYENDTIPLDVDENSNLDYCLEGTWHDCFNDSQCDEGYFCSNNDCISYPEMNGSRINPTPTADTLLNLFGYCNASHTANLKVLYNYTWYNNTIIYQNALFKAETISAGRMHTCGIRANDSRVLCWGDNANGQIGDGDAPNDKLNPTLTADDSAYSTISSGDYHTCGIRANDSRVLCWGDNDNGQLGNGNTTNMWTPTPINDTTPYISIYGGRVHTCAIRNDSRVLCWGQNNVGQAGDGTTDTPKTNPTLINDSGAYMSVSAGYIHSCGIRANDSRVLCWGHNTNGQLGDGTQTQRENPTPINDTAGYRLVSTGGGDFGRHTCGIRANDSRVLCWGNNTEGALGDGTTTQRLNPTLINDTSAYTDVNAGWQHTCGIRANDSMALCWGKNDNGAVGDGSQTDRLNPALINDTATYRYITAGAHYSCGVRANDGQALCWGYNNWGQLGIGDTTQKLNPTTITDASSYFPGFPAGKEVLVGVIGSAFTETGENWTLSCSASDQNSQVTSWLNSSSTLITEDIAPVVHLVSPANQTNTTNDSYALACNITDDYQVKALTVYVWNSSGTLQTNVTTLAGVSNSTSWSYAFPHPDVFTWNCLGNDSFDNTAWSSEGNYTINYTPITVISVRISPALFANHTDNLLGYCNATHPTGGKVMYNYTWYNDSTAFMNGVVFKAGTLSAGTYHTCGIRANDSQVLCWGSNLWGMLGNGSDGGTSPNPIPINDSANYTAISAGYTHTCGIRANDSQVLCWGYNPYGALGDGTDTQHKNPWPINDTAYSLVGAGNYHTCGIRANDSKALCWGRNNYGMLGNGNTTNMYNPTLINDTAAYITITAAIEYTCGIRTNDSRVLCWGRNGNGQLGDGTQTNHYNPAPINDSAAYLSVSAGEYHACGILINGSVKCWGANSDGATGNGSTGGNALNPQLINDSAAYLTVSAGYGHTCAVRANDSQIMCWGSNGYGRLGNGSSGGTNPNPAPINDSAAYLSVSARAYRSCGIRTNDSQVLCWGVNDYGQLGNGNTTSMYNPTPINNTASFYPGWPSAQELLVSTLGNAFTSLGENWTLSCMATNTTLTSRWLNSSVTHILDQVAPTLAIQKNSSILEAGSESIYINWSATDGTGISDVVFNITYPDGSLLFSSSTAVSNVTLTFLNLTQLGQYNLTLWANDTSNNSNTANTSFSVNHTLPPVITWENPTPPDNELTTATYAYLNTTITDYSNTSAFFDWNNTLGAYWNFDAVNDTTVYDNSTGQKNLTNSTGSGFSFSAGKFGNSLWFSNGGEATNVTYDVAIANYTPYVTVPFTLEFWIYWNITPNASAEQAYPIMLMNSPSSWTWLIYGVTATNVTAFGVKNSSNDATYTNAGVCPAQTWCHIAFTINASGTLKGYRDGNLITTTTLPGAMIYNQTTNLRLGSYWSGGGGFNGSLDELRIYARELSWEEINASYNNTEFTLYHNFTNLEYGNQTYTAYAIDTAGHLSTSTRSVSILNLTLKVQLVSPANQTNTTQPTHAFMCNITDDTDSSALTLSIWNSTNDLITTNATAVGGIINSTNWTFTLPYADTYTWNCLGNDSDSNEEWSDEGNYTLTYIKPTMISASIIPTPSANNSDTLYGYCNATDPFEEKLVYNYTWYIDGAANITGMLVRPDTLTSGERHTCAIRTNDSRVLCWGDNSYGQLGNGTDGGNLTLPTLINDTAAYTTISAGYLHTCGIRANDSRVLCWGYNQYGQLGNGSNGTDQPQPTPISEDTAYTTVKEGDFHTCGIRANDSKVMCWGSNTYGQMGNGTDGGYSGMPQAINDTANYSSIGSGEYFSCAIRANDSQILCWGRNNYGQLGNGSEGGNTSTPQPTTDTAAYAALGSNSYAAHMCGIRANDSQILCWGYNSAGQLGNGSAGGNSPNPTPVNDSAAYRSIGLGGNHACGIRANDSQVLCWGSNYYGQLGNGSAGGNLSQPTEIPNATQYVTAGGSFHMCGIGVDSHVYCWGRNQYGQLGNGSTGGNVLTPTATNDTNKYPPGWPSGQEMLVSTILDSLTSRGEEWILSCSAIDANTSSTWLNSSITTIMDGVAPIVAINVNASVLEYSVDSIFINWSATDETELDTAVFNITYPNGTVLFNASDAVSNVTLTADNLTIIGNYTALLWANDTSENTNTTTVEFFVNDTLPPEVHLVSPANESSVRTANNTFTCNITDNYGVTNLTLHIWNSSNNALDLGKPSCYQESANINTSCGGNDTGTYACTGDWDSPCASTYDGNWKYGGNCSSESTGTVYINYTKPAGALNTSFWQVKDEQGTANLTIAQSCWDYDSTTLMLSASSTCSLGFGDTISWACYNGTWKNLRGYFYKNILYEEAMFWNFSNATTSLGGTSNSTSWNVTFPYVDVFTWNCEGSDTNNAVWSSEGNYTINYSTILVKTARISPALFANYT